MEFRTNFSNNKKEKKRVLLNHHTAKKYIFLKSGMHEKDLIGIYEEILAI